MRDPAVGLCSDCQHCRLIKNDRKTERSTFYMCLRSLTQPEYRKYPPLPVHRCPGYEQAGPSAAAGSDDKLTE